MEGRHVLAIHPFGVPRIIMCAYVLTLRQRSIKLEDGILHMYTMYVYQEKVHTRTHVGFLCKKNKPCHLWGCFIKQSSKTKTTCNKSSLLIGFYTL